MLRLVHRNIASHGIDHLQQARRCHPRGTHYNDVIISKIASQITSLTIVYSIVYSDADQIKHQSSASLAFVRGIHRGPVKSPHKWPVTRKMFPFDDVFVYFSHLCSRKDRKCKPISKNSIPEWLVSSETTVQQRFTCNWIYRVLIEPRVES